MANKLIAFFLILTFCNFAFAAGVDDLQKSFQTPPDDARIMMRWWWFGPAITKPELERELQAMKAGGIGGVEVQPVYPLELDDTQAGIKNLPYLSDEFLEMLKFTAQKTKELGMRFDLTLGSGWSFGGAKTPVNEAAGQLRIERVKIDANTKTIPLPSMIPAEKLLGTYLVKTDGNTVAENDLQELKDIRDDAVFLSEPIVSAGSTTNEVLFIISGKAGMQVKRPAVGAEGFMLNHLDKPSVENYLKYTGDRLFQAFDKNTRPFSVFSDSLEVYNEDWTDDFLQEFQKRRGYDLKPFLPALVMDMGKHTADIRYDWGRTLTELFNERFAAPMTDWAHRNGTLFRSQNYGIPPAAISSSAFTDISDGEGAQWKVVRAARWASSANHIYGKNITSSETWTWLHSPVFRATPLDLKAEADIHFLQGINQLIGHGWGYTPIGMEYPGGRFYAAGSYTDKNPWYIVMPDLAIYLQRMSWLMRQGQSKNDVALYLPNADAYAHFSAGKVHLIEAERELVGEKIMPAIFEAGYNLDFFDDEMLKTIGKVEGDNLDLGASKYRAVVLPGIERMPLESLRKLDEFVKNGGILIASRRKPEVTPGYKTTEHEQNEFNEITKRLFGSTNANVKFVQADEEVGNTLKTLLQPDVSISPAVKDFGFVHRQTADAEIYFVANTTNQKQTVNITFRSAGSPAQIWNALDGTSTAANIVSQTKTDINISLEFEPYQSHIVVFSKNLSSLPFPENKTAPISELDLSSDWKLTIGQTNQSVAMKKIHLWTDEKENLYFSGTADYEKEINVPENILKSGFSTILDFGEATSLPVQATKNGMQTWLNAPVKEAAVIYVNNQRAGSVWCPPYKLDVRKYLRAGSNKIRIVVGNTALNYLAGHSLPNYRLLNLRYGERFQPQDMDKIQPLASGLAGDIRLIISQANKF
ncbi:MAG: glycoside hydrolase [Acidobacteriota bacterium]|nr:glycoside hydrolase [Acidobacteriota bacterium]